MVCVGNYSSETIKRLQFCLMQGIHFPAEALSFKELPCKRVKIVKCTVKNIPVDISFNQMAGLCTLCFMEQVDELIGKDHLFKRSILLIKAWCYYESRILGAHHGLISTYALETLVLYIVNLFHESLRGPLDVFYKFLEYYSTFDWSNYCITINGPVALSSFAEVTAEGIEAGGDGLLLSMAFLRNCRDLFSLPIKAHEVEVHEFPIKRLNILDPLNEKNNLGRSVSKGNFHRIMCALSHGAQKLGEILLLPGASMGEELEKFFENTLDRNGRGERPDALVPVHAFGTGKCEPSDLTGDYDSYYGGLHYTQLYHEYALAASVQPGLFYSYVWDQSTLTWTLQLNGNGFFQGGTDGYYPMVPFYHPYPSQLSATGFDIAGMERSRGTGTFIPELTHELYKDFYKDVDKDVNKKVKKKNPEPTRRGLWIKSAHKIDQVDSPTVTGKDQEIQDKKSSPPDLSLEQFPVLQVTTRSNPPAISESAELSAKTMQLKQSTTTFGTIKFPTFKRTPSPLGLPSQLPSEQADPATSYPTDSTLYSAALGVQKKEELSVTVEKRISGQLYELEDGKDFPPLAF
ncbi:uncharacterized protein LOC112095308 [Morus notabilis]|uniref:uncharacterized protein LOC112095308 n=1 Tax=Morus notabilis TaxID=981085 RepID=UPI000CED49CE|nr:uncharacterized protein LOC112095308 [Morus notabilis]